MFGWGTWTRTTIDGVRDRCPTIRRSPNQEGAHINVSKFIRQMQISFRHFSPAIQAGLI